MSKLGIKISDANSHGLDCEGIYLDSSNALIQNATVNDLERFKIWPLSNLDDAVIEIDGDSPTRSYYKDPTGDDNAYKDNSWTPLKKKTTCTDAKVIAYDVSPVIVTRQEFNNEESDVPAKYSAKITHQVQNTVSHVWKETQHSVGVEGNIEYKVKLGAWSTGGGLKLSYTNTWGKDKIETETVTLGSSSAVEVNLDPGKIVIATLSAYKGTAEILVDYHTKLEGHVVCDFEEENVFKRFDISKLMRKGHLPRCIHRQEVLTVEYYTEARVSLSNALPADRLNNRNMY